jgi:uncharacterized protein YbcI
MESMTISSHTDAGRRRSARQVAQAAGAFEHLLMGRAPKSVTVVADGKWMVVSLHEAFSAVERRLVLDEDGADRVREYHRYLFDNSLDALRTHVRQSTGVELRGAIAHVDTVTGSVLKTFTTNPAVELFLLGQGLPTLGVPVNTHLHADEAGVKGSACN